MKMIIHIYWVYTHTPSFYSLKKGLKMFKRNIAPMMITMLLLLTGCEDFSTSSKQNKTVKAPTNTTAQANTTPVETTPAANTASLKQINVLVVVDANDAGTKNGTTRTKIDHFMSVTNKVFQNSTVAAKLNIVKVQPYTFQNQNSKNALSTIYKDGSISSIRNSVNADLVIIYRNNTGDGVCGVAYLNKTLDRNLAYAHVNLKCSSTTTAHEVGHTMGLNHSSKKTPKNGRFAYGRGYGVDGAFSTVMSYKSTYRTSTRVFNYSSPSLDCKGYECGVANSADSVTALNNSIQAVSSFN